MSIFNLFKRNKNAGKVFDASSITGLPTMTDAISFSHGAQSTVVMDITCGGCGKKWKDALVPGKETRVTCPHCRGTNRASLPEIVIVNKRTGNLHEFR
jgi:hypothetical protein